MAVKSSASSLAQSHGHEKESTSTPKDLLKHHNVGTATIDQGNDQGSNKSNDDQNYKHFSAAGEHFARKKSEGEHNTLFHRLVARVGHPEGRDEGEQEEDEEAPLEDQYKHYFSAAGEHFAKKRAEKTSLKSPEKMEKQESAENLSVEEDRYRHLSAAGEHFAKKKADKKSLKSPKKKEIVDGESAECKRSVEKSANEADPYKHLSAAGEHFARRKSDGESLPSLFRRMSSSFTGTGRSRSNSITTEDWGEEEVETDRFQHLSSAGEHFARKKAEKKKARRASKVNGRGHSSKREEEEVEDELTEGHVLGPSSNLSPNPYKVVQQKSGNAETTLAAEEDGEQLQKEENNTITQNSAPNRAAETAHSHQLDEIQRAPAYTLHRDLVIGKGSYGHVCIASRGEAEGHFSSKPGTRKKFACKCVSLPSNPKHICRLQEEVNVLRVLRGHANVIGLYDVFVLEDELLVITELGTGGDLFHLLATHPKHGVSEEYAGKIHITYYVSSSRSSK